MAVQIKLGDYDVTENLPLYSQNFQVMRENDQSEAIIKYVVTLSGFLESHQGHEAVRALYAALQPHVTKNRTFLTYIDGAQIIHDRRLVFVESFNEPEDQEYAKQEVGDYSISLYYFGDTTAQANPAGILINPNLTCSYGAYTFEKTPNWGRSFSIARPSHRSTLVSTTGKIATISLTGRLYSGTGNYADLQAKIDALQAAFNEDRTLIYGGFNQAVRTAGCEISDIYPLCYAPYKITLVYDVGQSFNLTRSVKFSRLHMNPVIHEEPGCNRRNIELMNLSGQTVNYSFQVEAPDIDQATQILQAEAAFLIEPGGVEMPGGEEAWGLDNGSVNLSVTKFYTNPILGNMTGS